MSTVPQDRTAAAPVTTISTSLDSRSALSHAPTETAAFGEFLRRARQQRGISLQQICKETKIPRAHLEALEEGNFALVPPGTYRRGEVVAYAAVVGLDRSVALSHLESALQSTTASALAARPTNRKNDAPPRIDRGRIRLRPGPRTTTGIGMGAAMTIVAASLWAGVGLKPLTDATPAPSHRQPDVPQVAASSETDVSRGTAAPSNAPEQAINTRTSTAAAATLRKRDTVALPAGRDGRLVVITQPPGARVTINGVGWGVTPLTVDHLPPGTKRIRVTSDGFSAAERTLELPAAGETTVRIPLQARAGSGPSPPQD